MKTHATLVSVLLIVGIPTGTRAQAAETLPPGPSIDVKTPAECNKSIGDWRNAAAAPHIAAMRAATTPEARDSASKRYSSAYISIGMRTLGSARDCAAKFDLNTISVSQLTDLINLYTLAVDTTGRRRATERLLSATDLPPRQRAQALIIGMNQEVAQSGGYFGIIDGAERVINRIDALPDSLADLKLSAHQSMLGRYEYLDVNEGLRKHAAALIDIGRRLGNQNAMMSGFSSLARSAADRLQPDSALMILDNAEKELGAEKAATRFAEFRRRYALIGTKAALITGEWWLNVPGTPAPVQPGDGKVRLVEFTATWCMPCKNSYPGLRDLAARFRGKDFEGVLVTSLYGYLGDRRNLTPEQEVDADREYYTKEHALPFKVAINPSARGVQPKVDTDYRVGGIPQIVIVDRRGAIRQIVTGWDHGNTKRIGDLIDRLLKEPMS